MNNKMLNPTRQMLIDKYNGKDCEKLLLRKNKSSSEKQCLSVSLQVIMMN